jgi:hypothetical protein
MIECLIDGTYATIQNSFHCSACVPARVSPAKGPVRRFIPMLAVGEAKVFLVPSGLWPCGHPNAPKQRSWVNGHVPTKPRSGFLCQSKNSALTFGQIPIARVKPTTKLPDPSVLISAAELSEVVALTFDARRRRASVGGHARPVETFNRSPIRRSKIFVVEIHGRFDTESVETCL